MSSIKKNFTANFVGKIWTTTISLIFLPYYVKLIGFEAYGLVGIYTALVALSTIFDLGLGSSMTREMARLSSQPNPPKDFRDLTRTLEVIYWTTAIGIAICVFLAAPFISEHWVNAKELPRATIKQGIFCMGIALGFLWPSSLYIGGLMGLQKQVLLNTINVIVGTVRAIGMVLILTYVSPTIQAFFIWQIIINIIQTCLTALFLWRGLPKGSAAPRFDKTILGRLRGYAIGIAGVTIIGMTCIHLDKMFLSRILPLDLFGYYTFANTITWVLPHIAASLYSVFFPRFSQLISLNDHNQLKHIYHISCQLMSALVVPTALFVIFFSSELIFLWTQSLEIVQKTSFLVKLLMTQTVLNALLVLPTALQYAYGWTRLSFYLNLLNLILMIPLMYWSAVHFGAEGVAWVWIVMNAGFLLLSVHMMHRRIIKDEKSRWFIQDVGLPFVASLAVIVAGRCFFPEKDINMASTVLILGSTYVTSLLISILVSPYARNRARETLMRLFSKTVIENKNI